MPMEIDPVTFEVLNHRLWQINDEQGVTIRTISTSPIVVDGNDFNVGLFTAEGDLVVAGPYVVNHVDTMDVVIKHVIAQAVDVEDGDMFLVNDPYAGALHHNDVAVVGPLFHEGRPVAWIGNVVHHADVGGIDEGSFCVNARNIFHEPPRYFLRVVSRGRVVREVERTFVTNSRLPDSAALDLRAQIGAVNVARRRLDELIAQRGVETVLAVMRRSLDYAEQRLRRRFAELPDGSWSTEVFMDTDRVGSDRIIRVALRLDKRGEELHFDYEGTDPQSDGPVNATYSACYSGTTTPVYTFVCGSEIDWNGAMKRCVHVRAPEGSVMNARFPAAVSICSIGFTWLATLAATRVVAQLLYASPAYRDRACAPWCASANALNIFGTGSRGRTVGALLSDHRATGSGGRSFADGFDHAGMVVSYLSFMADVESQEWKLPLLYGFRRQLPDSAGRGMHRGGLTALTAFAPYRTERLLWKSQNTAGCEQTGAAGLYGGYPGAGSQVSVVRGAGLLQHLAAGRVPLALGDLGGSAEHLPSKSEGVLGPDDAIVYFPPGGGGYGDPVAREPARVASDVRAGAVTAAWAQRGYGVELTEAGEVDAAATAETRARLRAERRLWAPVPPGLLGDEALGVAAAEGAGAAAGSEGGAAAEGAGAAAGSEGPGAAGGPPLALTAALELAGPAAARRVRCRQCGHDFGPADRSPLAGAVYRASPLGEAGPHRALRWDGDGPHFHLLELACPGCGVLLEVREQMRQAPAADAAEGGRGR